MGYSITQATASDNQEELISLINRNFEKSDSQWFRWSHQQNPFGENYCWLAREESIGQLIGSAGLLTRRMSYAGNIFTAGQAEFINIDQEHRSAQAALKLQRAVISHLPETEFHFVYGMTDEAAAIFKRCRYKEVGTFQHWVKPIRSEYKFKDRIRSSILRKSTASLVDLAMRAYSLESRTFLSHRNRINFDAPIDDRFEALFTNHSDGVVMVERTREFLEWRFRKDPHAQFHVMTLENHHHELLGYLVYRIGETGRNEDHAAGIHDFIFKDMKSLKQMLTAFCQHSRQIGMDSIVINYFGREEVMKLFSRFGFFQRQGETKVFLHANPQNTDFNAESILNRNRWHLTNAEFLS